MALVVNSVKGAEVGRKVLSLAADNSYPTGGYAFDLAAKAGVKNVDFVGVENAAGYDVVYDRANKKLMFYVSGGTQVSNAVDLSALTDIRLLVMGR